MQTNTLVTHKKLSSLGIGCVSKVLSSTLHVNFGLYDVKKCKPDQLLIIDTSGCKKIPFSQFQSRILNDKSTLDYCIVGNELKHYVGIGWISLRPVTMSDIQQYPIVVQ